MKIIISALHFEWADIAHCLSRVRGEFGLDGVEFSFEHSFARPHCTKEDLSDLRRRAGRHGLQLSAHIWENIAMLGPERGAESLVSWLGPCADTGVKAVVVHGGSWPDRAEGIARTRAALDAAAGEFLKAGVELYFENHYGFDYKSCNELFSEPWEFAQILGRSPNIGFCFDTGHGNMTGNSAALISELAPFLRYAHLADNHGVDDDHCPYGMGTVPWPGILALLRDTGFDGTFCVEFPVRDNTAPFYECLRALRETFNAG